MKKLKNKLLKLAEDRGFQLKNEEYYLYELQEWLRKVHDITMFVAKAGEYGHPDNPIISPAFNYYVQQKRDFAICMGWSENTNFKEVFILGLIEALKLIKYEN